MNWTHILMAGYAGMAIAVVASLLRKKGWLSKGSAIVLVVVFIALWNVIDIKYLQGEKLAQTADEKFDATVQQVPAWKFIAEHDPALMAKLRAQVMVMMKEGANEQKVIDAIQPQILAVQMQRLQFAPDDLVVAEMRVMMEQAAEIQAKSDDACFRFQYPAVKGGINPVRFISPQMLKRRLDTEAAMLNASYGPNKHTVTAEERANAQRDIATVVQPMAQKYGQDLQLLDAPQNAIGKEKLVCDMLQQLWGDVLALPPQKAAAIVRLVLATEEQ